MTHYFIDIHREDIALWRVADDIIGNFYDNDCYFEVTGLLDVDYATISMFHPPMSQESWGLIGKAKILLDEKADAYSSYIVLDAQLEDIGKGLNNGG